MPRSPFDLTDQPPPERPLRADTAAGHLCRDGSGRVGRQDREHDRHHRVRYVVVDLELGRTMARTHRSRSCGTTLAPLGAIPSPSNCLVRASSRVLLQLVVAGRRAARLPGSDPGAAAPSHRRALRPGTIGVLHGGTARSRGGSRDGRGARNSVGEHRGGRHDGGSA